MTLPKSVLSMLLILPLLFGCTNETADLPIKPSTLEALEEFNVSYGDDPEQVIDIYLPANRTVETKTLVLVHGGGWTSGDKTDMDFVKELIKQNIPDVAIANLNYRLADEDNRPFPMQIEDISAALQFIKAHRETYVISDEIGFIGISAGAHLSMLYSYAFDDAKQVNMVCSIVGPTNFTDPAYTGSDHPLFKDFTDLYGIDTSDSKFLKDVSPFHNLKSDSPPTILFNGGLDPLIPTSQGTAMRDKLTSLGIANELTIYENAGHGWTGLQLIDTWAKLSRFIEQHL